MHYTEAREHTHGRLHELFSDPYEAFDNDTQERLLHLRIMLYMFVARPMERELLTLRVIHGWENGGCEPADLACTEYPVGNLEAFDHAVTDFTDAHRAPVRRPFPQALESALAAARARGQAFDEDIEQHPVRWPAFEGGLTLYTLFKMYHRLVYGEDDFYRSSQCHTAEGLREIHEFHLEEGEFAFLIPRGKTFIQEESVLILHQSQLEPMRQLLKDNLPLFRHI